MTERERWVVYPLLFLALGAALRDKLIDRTTTKSIVCQELLVIDEQPLGREPVLLARIGRAERSASGGPSKGQFLLNGQVNVNGQVIVDGAINAKLYAYQGIPIVPALRAVFPGVSLPDLLRAIPQAVAPEPGGNAPPAAPQTTPPVEQSRPADPADDASEPPQSPQPGGQPSAAEPLADPVENR